MNQGTHGNMNWNMMNNNIMQHNNLMGMPQMSVGMQQNILPNQMMASPAGSNNPVPHPPMTPKSSHNMPISHHHLQKLNQMQMNQSQGHIMQNPMIQGQGHTPHPPSVTKVERESPQVQVPHISQSQIPPRAKAASRNQMMQQQHEQMQQQQHHPQQHMMPHHNQNTMMNVPQQQLHQQQQQQKMFNYYGPFNPQQYQHQQQQQQQMFQQQYLNMPYNGQMNNGAFNPNCQQNGQDQRSPYNKVALSPGCNQVTSSTDIVNELRTEPEAPPIENFMDNLNSISAENFMDNINSISQENMNQVYSPTAMGNRSGSQLSRYSNALMNTSNMVVNDMSSTMLQLAEENKFFSQRH